jgi:NADPH-dependent ferric siderophore reductase
MMRITLGGDELAGFSVELPAASVRLLLPAPGEAELVMPAWNGNEFLLADGRRPTIRTFTPRRADPDGGELDVEVVIHEEGAASRWAASAREGDTVAVSGPGRGYAVDSDAGAFLLAGDETAIPAISQLLEHIPHHAAVQVHIEVARPDARRDLPHHPGAHAQWWDLPTGSQAGAAMLEAVRATDVHAGARVWAAGEAAAVQRIRRHLFEERGVARAQTSVRGYWKHGRTGDTGDDA